ncbi:MAG: DUF4145 domain-containing protein [Planctomycetota bacterium]|nr:DUF4145 domain-containing protein [Planctomycetota bacterium]
MSWSIKPGRDIDKTVSALCGECRLKTQHRILAAIDYSGENEGGDIQAWGSAQIIQCQGCETIGFRDVWQSSEDREPHETLYPERTVKSKSLTDDLYLRDDLYNVPDIIRVVYRETLSAVEHDLPTLAGIGIRAVIEAICHHLKAKEHNLQAKIDGLASRSLLTPDGARILHSIRELGNCAAHKMKAPSKSQITAALKIINHLLLGVYVLPREAGVLPKPRKKKPTKKTAKGSGTGGTAP